MIKVSSDGSTEVMAMFSGRLKQEASVLISTVLALEYEWTEKQR
jgi:hypothetical protein